MIRVGCSLNEGLFNVVHCLSLHFVVLFILGGQKSSPFPGVRVRPRHTERARGKYTGDLILLNFVRNLKDDNLQTK